ncbi:MAG: rod shape-determining protein MreD [Terriglobales bacterium]
MAASNITREQIEVYRFSVAAAIGVPLAALLLQQYLPLKLPFFSIFDLPLLVTIYFAVARRSPITGLLTGGVIGLVQDSLTHQPIGLYGMAKTVIGYAASSLGVKVDVDNPGSRILMTFGFYLAHQLIYLIVARGLAQQALTWRWGHMLVVGLANALLALVLFMALDHLRQRT